jgi:hypothetical protein
MPSSQTYAPDGASESNARGQKNTISDPFTLNGNVYRTETVATLKDGKVTSSEVKFQKQVTGRSGETFIDTAVTRNGGKDWVTPGSGRGSNENKPITTSNTNLTAQEIKDLQPGGKLNKTSIESAKLAVKKNGGSDDQASAAATSTPQAKDPNKPDATAGNATADDFAKIAAAAKGYVGRQAKDYPQNLKYPIKMDDNQDCIQFTVMEYQASKLGLDSNINTGLRTTTRTTTILTTITLPMPRGISDRNSVDWSKSEIGNLEAALADAGIKSILGGPAAGTDAAKKNLDAVTAGNTDLLKAIVAVRATESAVANTTNLLSRIYGVEMNPNMELLFNGPQLRDFSFSFRMNPRSPAEAKMVRSIIRTFKQAMSVKRSTSVLLLKSPHTFMIKYITSNKEHPYLNRFKECALTNCSVEYTPDGQYMSYDSGDIDERSMTAYELSLSFNELEPIFDDDYENMENAKGSFNHIGY